MSPEEEPKKPDSRPGRTIDISSTLAPTLVPTYPKSIKVELVKEAPKEEEEEEKKPSDDESTRGDSLGDQIRKMFRRAVGPWTTLLGKILAKIKSKFKVEKTTPLPITVESKSKPKEQLAQIEDTATLAITDALSTLQEDNLVNPNLVPKSDTVVASKSNSNLRSTIKAVSSILAPSLKKLLPKFIKPNLSKPPSLGHESINQPPIFISKTLLKLVAGKGSITGPLGNAFKMLGDTVQEIANNSSKKVQTFSAILKSPTKLPTENSPFSTILESPLPTEKKREPHRSGLRKK